MDALVVLGAWAGGSVVVSLAVGTVIARADRGSSRTATALPAPAAERVPAQVLALLPRPRTAGEAAAATSGAEPVTAR